MTGEDHPSGPNWQAFFALVGRPFPSPAWQTSGYFPLGHQFDPLGSEMMMWITFSTILVTFPQYQSCWSFPSPVSSRVLRDTAPPTCALV